MTGAPRRVGGLARWIEAPVAFLALVAVAPALVVASVFVALSSPGAVLFRQTRIGRRGVPFVLYKLRTMRAEATGPSVTARDDARVTRVGAILRRSKLDELPELWNVVRGDMSLVGPRPEVPTLVDTSDEAWQAVLEARPGLTDPVTLSLRDEESVLAAVGGDREAFYREILQPYKLEGYRAYLERRSTGSDLGVLVMTLAAVVFPRTVRPPALDELRRRGDRA